MTTPETLNELAEREAAILGMATSLYNAKQIDYVHYSLFYDMQCVRIASLRALAAKETK